MPKKLKTTDYTRRAIDKYNAKFDSMLVRLPKGTKDWIAEYTGKSANQFFGDLYREYREKYEAEHGEE